MSIKAAFALEDYKFKKVQIDYNQHSNNEIELLFDPSGVFKIEHGESIYELKLVFKAIAKNAEVPLVLIECDAIFKFAQPTSFDQIPTYFYANSIAIVFPYVRAFVSTVTLQANCIPMVLPTMNLSDLGVPLKSNTQNLSE